MGGTGFLIHGNFLGSLSRRIKTQKALDYLQSLNKDIVCVQELPYESEIIRNSDYLKSFNSVDVKNTKLNISFGIFSRFSITDSGFLTLSHFRKEVPNTRPSVCVWADIETPQGPVRFYNCYLQIRGIGIKERLLLLEQILESASGVEHPVVVCGDMNTTIPKKSFSRRVVQWWHKEPNESLNIDGSLWEQDERHLFLKKAQDWGFRDVLDIKDATWLMYYTSFELFSLKLDWFFVKNLKERSVDFGECITDHKPVLVDF